MAHRYDFRWNQTNLEHATTHGCTLREIEHLVLNPPRGFPRRIGDGKFLVIGRGQGNRMIQVIYVLDPPPIRFYVIHAMPLTTRRRH